MRFVGNYALGGLSPQIYDMPVIPIKKAAPRGRRFFIAGKIDYLLMRIFLPLTM
jgi:hypothetical protein